MFYFVDVTQRDGEVKRHIIKHTRFGITSFPLGEFPESPEMKEYEMWLAEGNEPNEWNGE